MLFAIECARAIYYRAISEAQVDVPLESVQRARAAHVTVQRAVVAVTQEAIRVCGGRAFLRRYPLERYARDARAAALMRPWTQEIAMQQAHWRLASDAAPRPAASFLQHSARGVPCEGKGGRPGMNRRAKCHCSQSVCRRR
jgi:hypothetical protein